jgi:hypothetical protein
MNLAGNQAKQLFKSLRTGSSPSVVGLWAAATAVDQMRKRSPRPKKELIAKKKLKPGESYVIRMPGSDEGSLAESLAPGTRVAEIETSDEGSIASQLLTAATDLIGAATQEPEPTAELEVAPSLNRRQRRKAAKTEAEEPAAEEPAAKLNRRQRRKAAKTEAEEPAAKLSRRHRRNASGTAFEAAASAEDSSGSLASTLVDVAASFVTPEDEATEATTPNVSRRQQRRTTRLASLEETEFDPEALSRRRRRKLGRSERRARKRPSRHRVRKARRRQAGAAKKSAKSERRTQPSRRKRRKIRAAERDLEYRQEKIEKRSTRRRRRQLRKAEKAFAKLT